MTRRNKTIAMVALGFVLALGVSASMRAFADDEAPADPPVTAEEETTEEEAPETTDEPEATGEEETSTEGEETAGEEGTEEAGEGEEGTEEAEAPAETESAPPSETDVLAYALDNFVLFVCAVLVLFMQAGFAMVEVGFNSAKNTVNILFKNALDICVGVLLYWAVGYSLMYGTDLAGGWLAWGGFGIAGGTPGAAEAAAESGSLNPQVDWFFQVVFAATAATIVSGAVAGRMKFTAYLIYSALLTGLIYPISGFWKWGGGWADAMGFYDFAGSVVVHAVGGFAGLAGAMVLGPRIGRFSDDGKPQAMPGHSLPLATLGVFILWVGWYGFNPGSQLAFSSEGDINATILIAANTTLSAAVGGVAAMVLSWCMFGKPDLSMALNGILAGLVGITANCDGVTNVEAMVIGAVAGVLVVLAIVALDKLKIDDPVGAFPVHGVCGVWGCIACAIFGDRDYWGVVDDTVPAAEQIYYGNWAGQLAGSIVIPIYAFVSMFILFSILKAVGELRVSAEEEKMGLDISEHGMQAYTPN